MKLVTLALMLACACAEHTDLRSEGRQKRLLFFDEGGALVQTYSNPYMNKLSENGQNLPYYGNFLNPFFNFIRHFGNSLVAYTIPVSNAILQAIRQDPNIQNTLVIIPKKNPVVAPNPLCEGMRSQIPSPNLCNNFLNCWDGWAFEQECPTGLLFSSYGYCDYADNVDCHDRKKEQEQLQPQPHPHPHPQPQPQPPPMCSKDFEAIRNQFNCNEFFICVNRQPVRFKCPADLAYSQILGVCDYADRVDCSSSSSAVAPGQHPAYPTPAPSPIIPPLADVPAIPQETPVIPSPPSIPSSPEIPAAPGIPSSPEIPSPSIPSSPIPSSPTIPASPIPLPSPIAPPLSPMIPPAPASIPPLPSLLPPGSVFPSNPAIYPAQRPLPTQDVFPTPLTESLTKPKDKLMFSDFFNPGCSPSNVAMSSQDAVRLLQNAMSNNP